MTLKLSLGAPIKPSRVVIIGANGFIGRTMQRHVSALNIPAVPITRKEIDLEHGTSAEKLAACFNTDDVIIVAAGVAPIRDAISLNRANVISQTICNAIRMHPVQMVVNISSDSVFSNLHDNIDETFVRSPSTIYGASHYIRELMLSDLPSGINVTNIHPTLLFGLNNDKAGYGFDAFFRQGSQNKPIQIFGDGTELRDYVWVEDIARLAMQCLLYRSAGSIIAASGVCLTFIEVAGIVAKHFNVDITHVKTNNSKKHPRSRRFRNDATFACFEEFKYSQPQVAFDAILREFSGMENKM